MGALDQQTTTILLESLYEQKENLIQRVQNHQWNAERDLSTARNLARELARIDQSIELVKQGRLLSAVDELSDDEFDIH
jgi:hypothetical protein